MADFNHILPLQTAWKTSTQETYIGFTYLSSENKMLEQIHVFIEAVPHTNKYVATLYTFQLTTSEDKEIWTDFHN